MAAASPTAGIRQEMDGLRKQMQHEAAMRRAAEEAATASASKAAAAIEEALAAAQWAGAIEEEAVLLRAHQAELETRLVQAASEHGAQHRSPRKAMRRLLAGNDENTPPNLRALSRSRSPSPSKAAVPRLLLQAALQRAAAAEARCGSLEAELAAKAAAWAAERSAPEARLSQGAAAPAYPALELSSPTGESPVLASPFARVATAAEDLTHAAPTRAGQQGQVQQAELVADLQQQLADAKTALAAAEAAHAAREAELIAKLSEQEEALHSAAAASSSFVATVMSLSPQLSPLSATAAASGHRRRAGFSPQPLGYGRSSSSAASKMSSPLGFGCCAAVGNVCSPVVAGAPRSGCLSTGGSGGSGMLVVEGGAELTPHVECLSPEAGWHRLHRTSAAARRPPQLRLPAAQEQLTFLPGHPPQHHGEEAESKHTLQQPQDNGHQPTLLQQHQQQHWPRLAVRIPHSRIPQDSPRQPHPASDGILPAAALEDHSAAEVHATATTRSCAGSSSTSTAASALPCAPPATKPAAAAAANATPLAQRVSRLSPKALQALTPPFSHPLRRPAPDELPGGGTCAASSLASDASFLSSPPGSSLANSPGDSLCETLPTKTEGSTLRHSGSSGLCIGPFEGGDDKGAGGEIEDEWDEEERWISEYTRAFSPPGDCLARTALVGQQERGWVGALEIGWAKDAQE